MNLYRKAKLAVKFRKAGEGHVLSESSSSQTQSQPNVPQQPRRAPTSDAQRAGQAAIARFQQQEKQPKRPHSATTTWKSRSNEPASKLDDGPGVNASKLRSEVEAEFIRESGACGSGEQQNFEKEVVHQDSAPILAVAGVFFICPFCSVSYVRQDIRAHMDDCLKESYKSDQILTPVNMIRSLNKDQSKVDGCVDVLCRYLDNILKNPDESKYRRIKQGNKVFQERVKPVKGSIEFLLACGFSEQPLPDNPGEMCFIIEEGATDVTEKLNIMKEILVATETCKPKLDRSLRVLKPSSSNSETVQLPEGFFDLSSDEVKKMQTERLVEVDRNSQLRTRAMREREEKNPARIYRFTLLRVKFPDGHILQGTFNAREKCQSLENFVREQLQNDWLPFVLSEPGGGILTHEESSFEELGLVPAAILHFNWDTAVLADLEASGKSMETNYLKVELLENIS
ncbi:UBX domain-containing protein 6-like isoform X1 [Dendronephthya gigantea]|uniref:UBX domain-containing protein 6-like isoform X1 n=1 Tax=Dendronephthya gigantea TaxID=151771 RepID=UPI00106A826E|nr:UBX domain-containing protein 6-like isoform X1 [Dendronephthya gigantea]